MNLDETAPRDRPGTGGAAPAETAWPIEPDPAVTNLPGRQTWRFAGGRPVAAEVGGVRLASDDPRLAGLGVRRDGAGRPWPAAFAHSPETGARLPPPGPAPDPEILDIDPDSAVALPLPGGLPAPVRAGRPAALYLVQENLGALEAWDGRAFRAMGRLPPPGDGPGLAADPAGLAYATRDRLVIVPLPQIGPALDHAVIAVPGLRFVSAPLRRGAELLALGARDGRRVLCRAAPGGGPPGLDDLGPDDDASDPFANPFAGPWTNRLGDAVWTGAAGFVACPAAGAAAFVPWPEGFSALPRLAPWRDRADGHHQLGMAGDRYHYAALAAAPALHRLDGPHLAAGGVTYAGGERFDVPWQAPAEALTLGLHAGALLVPLLALARDTVLLALDIPGPRGPFLRGAPLPAPVTGRVLHHAHGAGLRPLPVGLEVQGIGDAGALLHDRTLYLWSRSAGRGHALGLRA